MATRYLITDTIDSYSKKQVAKALSRRLWNLTRPDSAKNPRDITEYMFSVIEHPINTGDFAVVINDAKEIKKHLEADPMELAPFVAHLTNAQKIALRNYIIANDTIPLKQIISSLGTIKSQSELETDGWFAQAEV